LSTTEPGLSVDSPFWLKAADYFEMVCGFFMAVYEFLTCRLFHIFFYFPENARFCLTKPANFMIKKAFLLLKLAVNENFVKKALSLCHKRKNLWKNRVDSHCFRSYSE